MKDELRSATTMPGALSVMTSGAHLMLMQLVDSWAILIQVCTSKHSDSLSTNNNTLIIQQEQLHAQGHSLVRELGLSYWTMLDVLEPRSDQWTVRIMALEFITVPILKMLESLVRHQLQQQVECHPSGMCMVHNLIVQCTHHRFMCNTIIQPFLFSLQSRRNKACARH